MPAIQMTRQLSEDMRDEIPGRPAGALRPGGYRVVRATERVAITNRSTPSVPYPVTYRTA